VRRVAFVLVSSRRRLNFRRREARPPFGILNSFGHTLAAGQFSARRIRAASATVSCRAIFRGAFLPRYHPPPVPRFSRPAASAVGNAREGCSRRPCFTLFSSAGDGVRLAPRRSFRFHNARGNRQAPQSSAVHRASLRSRWSVWSTTIPPPRLLTWWLGTRSRQFRKASAGFLWIGVSPRPAWSGRQFSEGRARPVQCGPGDAGACSRRFPSRPTADCPLAVWPLSEAGWRFASARAETATRFCIVSRCAILRRCPASSRSPSTPANESLCYCSCGPANRSA